MTDKQALLAAIAANPDDDTVRLAYADFLEESGEEAYAARAEFIRLQIKLARLRGSDPEAEQLLPRHDQLVWEWDSAWKKDMPDGFEAQPAYRRGFAFRATARASAVAAAVNDPRALLIEELDLEVDVPPSRLRDVVPNPLFARLTTLKVKSDLPIGFSGGRAIAEGEYPQLERLSLARQGIGNIGVKAICESWGLIRLRELDLSDNHITDFGAETLLNSHLTTRLRRLSLAGNEISWAAMQRLSERCGGAPIWT